MQGARGMPRGPPPRRLQARLGKEEVQGARGMPARLAAAGGARVLGGGGGRKGGLDPPAARRPAGTGGGGGRGGLGAAWGRPRRQPKRPSRDRVGGKAGRREAARGPAVGSCAVHPPRRPGPASPPGRHVPSFPIAGTARSARLPPAAPSMRARRPAGRGMDGGAGGRGVRIQVPGGPRAGSRPDRGGARRRRPRSVAAVGRRGGRARPGGGSRNGQAGGKEGAGVRQGRRCALPRPVHSGSTPGITCAFLLRTGSPPGSRAPARPPFPWFFFLLWWRRASWTPPLRPRQAAVRIRLRARHRLLQW